MQKSGMQMMEALEFVWTDRGTYISPHSGIPGKLLTQLDPVKKEAFWQFGQVVMVPLCLACMASKSWLGVPLFFSALFKFGFPEVTGCLVAMFVQYKVGRGARGGSCVDCISEDHGGSFDVSPTIG